MAAAAPGDTLGVFIGGGNTRGVSDFGARLNRSLTYAHDFLDRRTWATMTDVQQQAGHWTDAGFGDRMVFTAPMFPDTGGSLAEGARGDYDEHFRTLAKALIAGGQSGATLRIGPEFNGRWYKWTIDQEDGAQLYVRYWRRIVDTMRSVNGAHFTFDWCANNGSAYAAAGTGQLEAEDAYPGDDYVDFVGLDVYDHSWSEQAADPVARWNEFLSVKNGLRWQAGFAAAHGKPMTYPEWGLADRSDGHGGGDDPYFVEQMHQWIATHDVAYSLYFESTDPNGIYGVFSGHFPNAEKRFVELFSAPKGTRPAGAGAAPGAPGEAAAHTSRSDGRGRAQLRIRRARLRGRRLDLVATVSRTASGRADIRLKVGRRVRRYRTSVNARSQIRLYVRVPASMGRKRGSLSLHYAGDDDTRPQTVRRRTAR